MEAAPPIKSEVSPLLGLGACKVQTTDESKWSGMDDIVIDPAVS